MSQVPPVCLCSVWAAAVTVLLLIPVSSVEGNELVIWKTVLISQTRLYQASIIEVYDPPAGTNQAIKCSNTCRGLGWCNVWCKDQSTSSYIFSNMIVMPTYTETYLTDALTCYTLRPRDYATNAYITAGNNKVISADKEDLIDGIYGFTDNEVFSSKEDPEDSWIFFDFGQVVTFSHVTLVANPGSDVNTFKDVQVSVGKYPPTMSPEGFDDYEVFGWIPAPWWGSQEVEMESTSPKSARYISIRKVFNNDGLKVAHVQVY
ncbi:hypothetical protein Hamer_G019032 [Homarus americanus]|uniref:F5/8 type C domain-containing protein n=1 Tax=Homarus americanus TaxID=6706 RepID=A0A8J5K3Z4_HOMAM|nr:hypothetical protein Hamer_G019032 [Homarus americanus]